MKVWLSVLAILLPLGVMTAPAGNGSLSLPELQAQWDALSLTGSSAYEPAQKTPQRFLLAAEGAADEPGKSVGEPEDEEGGDEEKGEKEGEEEGGGEGGWDRLWDAPKLG